MNPGKVPIQEIQSGSGGNKLQALIGNYNYYLQMIRDVTGLNEATSGTPDPDSLVGLQKMAAANSNTATRHILQSGLFLTSSVAECLSLRISDIIEYSPTKEAFIQSIGNHNVATLKEMSELHLYDFGIFLTLQPDDEERSMLENNIQMALQQKIIDLDDAIDLRDIKNIKLANQLLKIRRRKKQEKDQRIQQENMQAQAQANQQAQAAAAQMEIQKAQAKVQTDTQFETAKAEIEKSKNEHDFLLKKELMNHEFQLQMQLKQLETDGAKSKEAMKESRKDDRLKVQSTHQSEMIDQKLNNKPPKNFESAGNDILGTGFSL
jgi:hypothetical protein